MVSAVVDVDPLSVVAGVLVVSGGWVDVDVGSSDPLVCAAVEVGRTLEVVGSADIDDVASSDVDDKDLVVSGSRDDVDVLSSVLLVSATVEIDWVIEVVGSAAVDDVASSDVTAFLLVVSDGWDVDAPGSVLLATAAVEIV